jgi:2-polyprenyl-3-methyl-5-hydroxy-6-metoxy-1,4-benzoquinol methylase
LLGGHKITLSGVKQLLQNSANKEQITICEIGCGGGDNLAAINKYCMAKGISVKFIGIDLKAECIEFAKQQYPNLNAAWVVSDYKQYIFNEPPDIIFSSLFCHHFKEAALCEMLIWKKQHAKIGFFINDLERNTFAYYAIKTLTKLFSKSYLVKNDAPLSVARGFTKFEWRNIINSASLNNISIKWKWAFRHLIVYKTE